MDANQSAPQSSTPHRRRWGAVLAGVLLLLALTRTTVSAAAVFGGGDTATVTIAPPATTAVYTITWSGVPPPVGITDGVELRINGAVFVAGPLPATGSQPLTVTAGMTYVATLRDKATGRVSDTQTITAVALPPACQRGCITGVTVTPHGTFATFAVATAAPTKLHIDVGIPNSSGQCLTIVASADSPTATSHTKQLIGLKAIRLHCYVLRATDATNVDYTQNGTFTTLGREVTVSFNKLHMIDDSDDLSTAELDVWFHFNDIVTPFLHLTAPDIGSGDDATFSLGMILHNAPETLKLRIIGLDDDAGPLNLAFDCVWVATDGFPPGSGSNDCADWVTEIKTFDVSSSGVGLDASGKPKEEFDLPLNILVSSSLSPLEFRVFGEIKVRYD